MALIKCPECGKQISDTVRVCPKCGYKRKRESKINKKKLIIICSVLLLVLVVGLFWKETTDKDCHKQLVKVGKEIYWQSLLSEVHCYNISQIWYDTIYDEYDSDYYDYIEDDDFNTSIDNYLTDKEDELNTLKKKQKSLEKEIAKIKGKHSIKYKEASDKLMELYGIYNKLVSQAISPTGTYSDYTSKYHKYSEEFDEKYSQLVVLVPEIESKK